MLFYESIFELVLSYPDSCFSSIIKHIDVRSKQHSKNNILNNDVLNKHYPSTFTFTYITVDANLLESLESYTTVDNPGNFFSNVTSSSYQEVTNSPPFTRSTMKMSHPPLAPRRASRTHSVPTYHNE